MLDRLKLLIRSENSIIALDTRDEVQGVELVRKAADDMAVPLFERVKELRAWADGRCVPAD